MAVAGWCLKPSPESGLGVLASTVLWVELVLAGRGGYGLWRDQTSGMPWEAEISVCRERQFHTVTLGLHELHPLGTRHLLNKRAEGSAVAALQRGEKPQFWRGSPLD